MSHAPLVGSAVFVFPHPQPRDRRRLAHRHSRRARHPRTTPKRFRACRADPRGSAASTRLNGCCRRYSGRTKRTRTTRAGLLKAPRSHRGTDPKDRRRIPLGSRPGRRIPTRPRRAGGRDGQTERSVDGRTPRTDPRCLGEELITRPHQELAWRDGKQLHHRTRGRDLHTPLQDGVQLTTSN